MDGTNPLYHFFVPNKSSPQLMPAFFGNLLILNLDCRDIQLFKFFGKSVEVERCTKSSINIDQHRDLDRTAYVCLLYTSQRRF